MVKLCEVYQTASIIGNGILIVTHVVVMRGFKICRWQCGAETQKITATHEKKGAAHCQESVFWCKNIPTAEFAHSTIHPYLLTDLLK